jgi:hypothetical protein
MPKTSGFDQVIQFLPGQQPSFQRSFPVAQKHLHNPSLCEGIGEEDQRVYGKIKVNFV